MLAPGVALEIVDAMDRFAADGVGFARRMLDGTNGWRLYLKEHRVTFLVSGDTLFVVAVTATPGRR